MTCMVLFGRISFKFIKIGLKMTESTYVNSDQFCHFLIHKLPFVFEMLQYSSRSNDYFFMTFPASRQNIGSLFFVQCSVKKNSAIVGRFVRYKMLTNDKSPGVVTEKFNVMENCWFCISSLALSTKYVFFKKMFS